jgi:hypothetical protein
MTFASFARALPDKTMKPKASTNRYNLVLNFTIQLSTLRTVSGLIQNWKRDPAGITVCSGWVGLCPHVGRVMQ